MNEKKEFICNKVSNTMVRLLIIFCFLLFSHQLFSNAFKGCDVSEFGAIHSRVADGDSAATVELVNKTVNLLLGHTLNGAPRLVSCRWMESGEILFRDIEPDANLSKWVPEAFRDKPVKMNGWQRIDDKNFFRAESKCEFDGGFVMTWVAELDRKSSLIRLSVRASNQGSKPLRIDWFPAWSATWSVRGNPDTLHYWEPLSYTPRKVSLLNNSMTVLSSRIHSSDAIEDGKVPYWIFTSANTRIYFGLKWSGGWKAEFNRVHDGINFHVFLPENETQLTLRPGESISGPALMVTPVSSTDEAAGRAEWMRLRRSLSERIYGGPEPSFPFSWNHWYTVRFSIDKKYLERQTEAMAPYGFDYFIVDAGWYAACGDWTPHPEKFSPGVFEGLMKQVHKKGVGTGIWSCPQFVDPDIETPPHLVIDDKPGFHRTFIDGMLIDYGRSDFDTYLLQHIKELRKSYEIDWWKYDQDFFTAETRNGQMKNVVAFQEALATVRKAFPDLYIESCQSGGRMLNEFTVLSSQVQWIRDGGHTGINHVRSNFAEAIQAMGFLPPWTVLRWINRPNENDPDNDEFTRMYCRSAMAGVWGLIADLPLIGERQRSVIVREVERYRRLNALKYDCIYDIFYPAAGSPAAGIVFYNKEQTRAGLLFLRWDAKNTFEFPVALDRLNPQKEYRIEFVDTGEVHTVPGYKLQKEGLTLPFDKTCMSLLVFVEDIE